MATSSSWSRNLTMAAASALMLGGEAYADSAPSPASYEPATITAPVPASATPTAAGQAADDLPFVAEWLHPPLRDLPAAHERVIATLAGGGPVTETGLRDMGVFKGPARTLSDMRQLGDLPLPAAGQSVSDWWQEQRPVVVAEMTRRRDQTDTMLLTIMAGLGTMAGVMYGGSLYLDHRLRQEERARKQGSSKPGRHTFLGRAPLTVIDGDKPDGSPPSSPPPRRPGSSRPGPAP